MYFRVLSCSDIFISILFRFSKNKEKRILSNVSKIFPNETECVIKNLFQFYSINSGNIESGLCLTRMDKTIFILCV